MNFFLYARVQKPGARALDALDLETQIVSSLQESGWDWLSAAVVTDDPFYRLDRIAAMHAELTDSKKCTICYNTEWPCDTYMWAAEQNVGKAA